MDRGLFLELLRQLQDVGYRGRISFHFYNEPLLSDRLEEYAALTKQHLPECRIDLFTNGTLLDERRLQALLEAGVDKFTVTRHVKADLSGFEAALERLPESKKHQVRYLSYKGLPLTNRGGTLQKVGPKRIPAKLPCFIPTCTVVVTVKGNVVPCYEDFFQKNVMGNIREKSLLEIWNSPAYRNFRDGLKKGLRSEFDPCRSCNNSMVIA